MTLKCQNNAIYLNSWLGELTRYCNLERHKGMLQNLLELEGVPFQGFGMESKKKKKKNLLIVGPDKITHVLRTGTDNR